MTLIECTSDARVYWVLQRSVTAQTGTLQADRRQPGTIVSAGWVWLPNREVLPTSKYNELTAR